MDYKGPERRKCPRLDVNLVVSYRIKEYPDSYDLSQTKNIGQGGILLTTNCSFKKGTLLAMSIRFPFFIKKIEVTGEVVDCREVVKDIIYETRIKFLDLDKDTFDELGKFVQNRIK